MTDPRHPSGPASSQPGLHPQRAPGLQPQQHGTPGLHPQHHVTPGLHPQPQRMAPAGQPQRPAPVAPPPDDPIALVEELTEEEVGTATPAKKIKAFGEEGMRKHHDWKRTPVVSGQGACRVKSFHGKYSDQGIQYLDDAINEFLDSHPEVEVKFVTSTVMVFEGKIREPALVLNLWY
jgi:hypothetical protein